MLRDTFRRNLYAIRKANGWSQDNLSQLSGVGESYIARIERGAANPSLDVVEKLMNALGCSIEDLLGKG
jgi:transcriptional regulator with XRE-family HTH domain